MRPASRLTAVADLADLRRAGRGDPGGQIATAQPVRRWPPGRSPAGSETGPAGRQPRARVPAARRRGRRAPATSGPRRRAAPRRDEDVDDRGAVGPLDGLHQARAGIVSPPMSGWRGRRRRPPGPEPLPSVQRTPTGSSPDGADQVRRHLRALVEAHRGDEELQLRRAASSARASATRGDQRGRGQQEREQHDGRRGRHQQGDLAPHCSGSASRTPTPRTVWSSRGSAALSPSLRRSHDRWTSTVLSAPP